MTMVMKEADLTTDDGAWKEEIDKCSILVNGLEDTASFALTRDDDAREKVVEKISILVNRPEDTASSTSMIDDGASGWLCNREEVKRYFTILVNGLENIASSARYLITLVKGVITLVITLVKGVKYAICSAWMGLTSLIQQWRDKIIIYIVQRWTFTFFLAAIYMFQAVYFGRVGWITMGAGFVLLLMFSHFLWPKGGLIGPNDHDEFRPRTSEISEYHFWCGTIVIFSMALVLSFFCRPEVEEVPLFIQVSLLVVLSIVLLRVPILTLKQNKQFPFNSQKPIYGKKHASSGGSLADPEMGCSYHAWKS